VIDLADIRAAAGRLRGVAAVTPVFTSRTLDDLAAARVFVKCENLQRGGAFKIRGAYNRMAALTEDELGRGVFAYSSGNHAQAVAIAAGLLGTTAVVLMPEDAPATKLEATRGYGAEILTYDRHADDRVALGRRMSNEKGLTLVAPYDDPQVMAGQGTVALELLEQVPDLDALVVPLGGGGLAAGCATAAAALRPRVRVFGVEPEAGDDHRRSLAQGRRIALPAVPDTIADGLQAQAPGELTFEVNRLLLAGVVTVSDDQIVEAMRFLFERMKMVAEPSGAAGVAALLARRVPEGVKGRRVGVVISGGNVGAARFEELLGHQP
jgi:threo-3-hydroxy-L-aspartate ammonia-lyase